MTTTTELQTWTCPATGVSFVLVPAGDGIEQFWLARHPVTEMEYSGSSLKRSTSSMAPKVDVNWYEAAGWCTAFRFRLPTEAEWEHACRAGTTTEYSFGDDPELLPEYGWSELDNIDSVQPVEQKRPNPWGLYEMHGNVWEWCADESPVFGRRVLRGGTFTLPASDLRSASRGIYPPAYRLDYIGFRPARTYNLET